MKNKTALLTDSNSGLDIEEAKKLNVFVVPMPIVIDGEIHLEGVDITKEEFFNLQKQGAAITTSQPAPGDLIATWEDLLKEYEELVYIPMSSGLSSSCNTAILLAKEFDGRVQVVNNQRISVSQYQSVLDAVLLRNLGMDAKEIRKQLETRALNASIYIMVDSLEHLKKGGRITPAAESIGTLLHIKPILQIQGDKLDAFAKARGSQGARKKMLEAMENDLNTRFKEHCDEEELQMFIAYTETDEEIVNEWKKEVEDHFQRSVISMPLSLSVAAHTGPGCLAICCAEKVRAESL